MTVLHPSALLNLLKPVVMTQGTTTFTATPTASTFTV